MGEIQVSIHAPVMDANLAHQIHPLQIAGFNPRARDGREFGRKSKKDNNNVSIHAPVMDAKMEVGAFGLGAGFNPRARDGRECA